MIFESCVALLLFLLLQIYSGNVYDTTRDENNIIIPVVIKAILKKSDYQPDFSLLFTLMRFVPLCGNQFAFSFE